MGTRREGQEILEECVAQAPETGVKLKLCQVHVTPDAIYVMVATGKKIDVHLIPDLSLFADQHQDFLDRNAQYNGFQAAIDLLSRKYKVCTFSL